VLEGVLTHTSKGTVKSARDKKKNKKEYDVKGRGRGLNTCYVVVGLGPVH